MKRWPPCIDCGRFQGYMFGRCLRCSRKAPSIDELRQDVIDAACALRDVSDWSNTDPTPYIDALDRAVDAWRAAKKREDVDER